MTAKIYVLHEHDEWTDHLSKRLIELDLPFELWHLDQGQIDLSQKPPEGIFYSRISASSHTRGHRFAPELAAAVLAWLERHKRTVVNGSQALSLEISKVNQYMALEQAGIATPRTLVAGGVKHIVETAKASAFSSFITKHNRAGKGQGVKLFRSIAGLEEYVEGSEFDEPVDGLTLIQEYIEAPSPHITRHEFIDGKFFYGVKVNTSEGFELCPADACSIDDMFCPTDESSEAGQTKFEILTHYRPPFIEKFEAFLKTNNIKIAGIETIEDKQGNCYAYDVNTNTNYNSEAEVVAKQFGMLEMARYLGRELNQLGSS